MLACSTDSQIIRQQTLFTRFFYVQAVELFSPERNATNFVQISLKSTAAGFFFFSPSIPGDLKREEEWRVFIIHSESKESLKSISSDDTWKKKNGSESFVSCPRTPRDRKTTRPVATETRTCTSSPFITADGWTLAILYQEISTHEQVDSFVFPTTTTTEIISRFYFFFQLFDFFTDLSEDWMCVRSFLSLSPPNRKKK